MTPAQASDMIAGALRRVDMRVHVDPGALVIPPTVVLQPPSLTWNLAQLEPTEAVFELLLVVAQSDRSLDEIFRLLPLVVEALEDSDSTAVVRTAEPGTFLAGNTPLPCYRVRTEVAL